MNTPARASLWTPEQEVRVRAVQRSISYSNVVATLALFLVLGGASYAAVEAGGGPANRVNFRALMSPPADEQLVSVPGFGFVTARCTNEAAAGQNLATSVTFHNTAPFLVDVVGEVASEGSPDVEVDGGRFGAGTTATFDAPASFLANIGHTFKLQISATTTGAVVATVNVTSITRHSGTDKCMVQGELITN
jgi:hypothetical protein